MIDAAPASGVSKAHNAKQTVLAYQFETFVYSDSRFDSMASSVEDIAGQGNIASDAFNYVKGMFDKGTQYDGFRSNIEEMLATCRSQPKCSCRKARSTHKAMTCLRLEISKYVKLKFLGLFEFESRFGLLAFAQSNC